MLKFISYFLFVFFNIETIFCTSVVRKADGCPGCRGRIHHAEELKSVNQPLLIDKADVCRTKQNSMIIIVKSGSIDRRTLTRNTWAKDVLDYSNISILYAIGYPQNSSIQNAIEDEERTFQDILQFNFIESYFNLTIKTINVLAWFDRMCSKYMSYLFYVDDDVLINIEAFIEYVQNLSHMDKIEGWFEKFGRIQRKGIGGISKEQFPIDIVPDYLWGAAVLYPSSIVSQKLLPTIYSTKTPIFFRDDVFINGFIAQEAHVKRRPMDDIVLYDDTEDQLRHRMIVINFPTEQDRQRAWLCYRQNISCNENLFRKILHIITGIVIVIFCCFSCLIRSYLIEALLYDMQRVLKFFSFPFQYSKNINSGNRVIFSRYPRRFLIQSPINLKKLLRILLCLLTICITLCFIINE